MTTWTIFLLLFFASGAFAAPKGRTKPSRPEKPATAEKSPEETPQKKANGVDALLGLSVLGAQAGSDYWRNVSRSGYIGGLVLSGKGDVTAKSESAMLLEYMSASYVEFDASYRHFFGQSFYLQSVLGYASYSGNYGFKGNEKLGVAAEVTVPYKSDVGLIGIGIGNLWVWDSGFNLGCTWLGLNAPFYTSTKVSGAQTSGVETEEVLASVLGTDVEGRVESNIKQISSVYLLRLQIGYQF